MKWQGSVLVALVLAAGSSEPVRAQMQFHNVCSAGAIRVCASADVFIGPNNTLVVNVWNMSAPALGADGRPMDMSSYATKSGGWHTITAIGLKNLGYNLTRKHATVEARYFDGSNLTLLSKWSGYADAASLEIYNTGADTYGNIEGVVGCYDPGSSGLFTPANHVQTCETYPLAPYVQFTLSGLGDVQLTNDAMFVFQSQQVAFENCDVSNWDSAACLGNVVLGGGANMEVVPEPITLLLVGSGLLGVGAAQRRRRRGLDATAE